MLDRRTHDDSRRVFFRTMLSVATAILLPALVIALSYAAYRAYQYATETNARLDTLTAELAAQAAVNASSTESLISSIEILEKGLSLTKSESEQLAARLATERAKLDSLQETTSNIGESVGTLEKLRETDPELLEKYSKIAFLNENYVPKRLSEIKNQYLYSEKQTQYFLTDALPFLTGMLDAAGKDGVEIYAASAYRSFNQQDNLKNAYTVSYGEGANRFSADQGYSEHQLGTAVDLLTTGMGGALGTGFAKTAAYTWLERNAYKYGFILSYPQGNAYYIYEPWHWRFVGKSLATHLHDEGKHFYDLDQRAIDPYLVSLFDN